MSRRTTVAPVERARVRIEGRLIGPGDAFAATIEDIQSRLHRLELEAGRLGLAIAPLYLASARGSLRHVTACLMHQLGGGPLPDAMSDAICPGTSLQLLPIAGRDGLGERHAVSARGNEIRPGADVAAWGRRPDLGADLLASPQALSLCRGPVGAALLLDALARHGWMHDGSSARWSTDISGAHALVRALTAGADFPHPDPTATRGLVDKEVADVLAGIGWHRFVSTRMPGAPV